MNILDVILEEKKKKGISWDELSVGLAISAEGLRVAFKRNSVDEVYVKHIANILGIDYKKNQHNKHLNGVVGANVLCFNNDAELAEWIFENKHDLMEKPHFKVLFRNIGLTKKDKDLERRLREIEKKIGLISEE